VSPFPPSFSPRPSLFSESSRLLTATVRCSLSRPLCFHVLVSCPSRTIDLHVLCFQIVTNRFSRKSFPLIIICVARGCGGYEFPSELSMQAFKSLNSIIHILLRTLCRRQKTQLLCNQASPNSFSKIPGVWVSRTGDTGRGTRLLGDGCPLLRRILYIRNTHTSCAAGSKTRNAPCTLATGNADVQQFSGKLSPYFRDWNQDFQSA